TVDTAITDEHNIVSGNLLTNDSDPDSSDNLSVSQVNGNSANVGEPITLASGALVIINADGSYSFNPNGVYNSLAVGEQANESISYQIADGHGGFDTATLDITIN